METMQAPRAHDIQEHLDYHFLSEIGVGVSTPEPVWWWDRVDSMGSLAVLGWAWPVHNPDSDSNDNVHPILVPYCPQIIDEQTAELSDEELGAYLTLIQYVIDLHIAYWYDDADDDERQRRIDAELLDEMPALHRMLHDALGLAALRRAFDV